MYEYFANQLQIWLAKGQNCVAFRYAIKIFPDCFNTYNTKIFFV